MIVNIQFAHGGDSSVLSAICLSSPQKKVIIITKESNSSNMKPFPNLLEKS